MFDQYNSSESYKIMKWKKVFKRKTTYIKCQKNVLDSRIKISIYLLKIKEILKIIIDSSKKYLILYLVLFNNYLGAFWKASN